MILCLALNRFKAFLIGLILAYPSVACMAVWKRCTKRSPQL